ncbi:hypothetical protein [Nocardia sp. XZ_19_385]|uniref:hypothetical protein n=1 Tax=Nocardia sp. XZ_19_385 TaxID=2769488 RepID=UPI001890B2A3|nr:hypothetical protein [Nocardia sp. XZ_19_385]
MADRVADSFLPGDMRRALTELAPSEESFIRHLVEGMASDPEEFSKPALIRYVHRGLSRLRHHPEHGAALLAYYGRALTEPGHCRACNRELGARCGPGRRPQYCSNRCKQLAYRNRKRAQRLLDTDTEPRLDRSDPAEFDFIAVKADGDDLFVEVRYRKREP